MAKNVIHVSDTDAATSLPKLLEQVREGAEVVIEHDARPVAILQAAEPKPRTLSEAIALARHHEEETGRAPTADPDFADDMQKVVNDRKPWNPPAWD
jgi:antitoxin (DNA-binding transcriptional repressor) of toxin-antitoxin stability system